MASSMRITMRHCTVRTIRPPEIKDDTASGTRGHFGKDWFHKLHRVLNTSEKVKNSKQKENKMKIKKKQEPTWQSMEAVLTSPCLQIS